MNVPENVPLIVAIVLVTLKEPDIAPLVSIIFTACGVKVTLAVAAVMAALFALESIIALRKVSSPLNRSVWPLTVTVLQSGLKKMPSRPGEGPGVDA